MAAALSAAPRPGGTQPGMNSMSAQDYLKAYARMPRARCHSICCCLAVAQNDWPASRCSVCRPGPVSVHEPERFVDLTLLLADVCAIPVPFRRFFLPEHLGQQPGCSGHRKTTLPRLADGKLCRIPAAHG